MTVRADLWLYCDNASNPVSAGTCKLVYHSFWRKSINMSHSHLPLMGQAVDCDWDDCGISKGSRAKVARVLGEESNL
jgi:hypothetical protein